MYRKALEIHHRTYLNFTESRWSVPVVKAAVQQDQAIAAESQGLDIVIDGETTLTVGVLELSGEILCELEGGLYRAGQSFCEDNSIHYRGSHAGRRRSLGSVCR